ncbi:UNVERIFIED_CONTAM: hypothetical protein Slati_3670200 [Sesamum latifolium]|uniref:Uncharacterized protein n=1 Tax=Sesamum latifolium TaxID=2727402 RepID=A0AAW2U2T7_9LAMI
MDGHENGEKRPDSGRKWVALVAINLPEDGELIGGGLEQWVGLTVANSEERENRSRF